MRYTTRSFELLVGDRAYGGHDRADARTATREPGGERDQKPGVMVSSGEVLSRDVREVGDVLREHGVTVSDRCREDLRIGSSCQPKLEHGMSLDARSNDRLREQDGVHLVQQQLQCVPAAAVSRRCSSMRAAISSG